MANHPSAAKRHRQNLKRNTRNTALRSRMRKAMRAARSAIEAGAEDRKALVDHAVQVVQRMASKNLIHKNTASRYVSRVVQAYKKAS